MRKAERKGARTGSRDDILPYKAKKNNGNALMNKPRCKFHQEFIEDNRSNQRSLFSALKKLSS